MRHRHTAPFGILVKYHVKLPIFVARQWIRHRTANASAVLRALLILDNEFYVPKPEHLRPRAKANRGARCHPGRQEASASSVS